jgi:hypothetical protein
VAEAAQASTRVKETFKELLENACYAAGKDPATLKYK